MDKIYRIKLKMKNVNNDKQMWLMTKPTVTETINKKIMCSNIFSISKESFIKEYVYHYRFYILVSGKYLSMIYITFLYFYMKMKYKYMIQKTKY